MKPSPRIRRRARERALQFLFSREFTEGPSASVPEAFWRIMPTATASIAYAEDLVAGVIAHKEDLDEQINSALKNWSAERVGRVERNILRVALYEIIYVEDVPANAAINEAVELAKLYGGEESPGFVNAVLDRLKNRPVEARAAR